MHDEHSVNTSRNRSFENILDAQLTRRMVLRGGLAAATTSFFVSPFLTLADDLSHKEGGADKEALIKFKPVGIAEGSGPWPSISEDYQFEVLIPWGTPITPDGPAYRYPPLPEAQARQIGVGHDGMSFFPLKKSQFSRGGNEHGILVVNHEFGRNKHVLGKSFPVSVQDVRLSQHAHGVSVVEIKKMGTGWRVVESDKARRIHANTPVVFSGPAAKSELLKTPRGNKPLGTVNNCSNGVTPWGTYLTCEENFNGYFSASKAWVASEAQLRYGLSAGGFGYGWGAFDKRFDLSDANSIHEENRFGWVVEIDPMDARSVPVKRTALGRFKHEGIALTVGRDGRVVGYMGDDQRFDYIYKFVSEGDWQAMRARGLSPLDHGILYAARFYEDGSGEWLALTIENPVLASKFKDQAEVLVYARMAADMLGATPMDRPEWTTVAPNGDVYCSLTNNTKRKNVNAANPTAPNPAGHIIRWRDSEHHVGLSFEWDIFLMAQDSHGTEGVFSNPDGLWADPDGRLFIQTDGYQKKGLNNQLLVADTNTGELRRLLTGVKGDEITGMAVTPDRRTLFVNIQHPGNGDPTQSNFPVRFDGKTIPRDATLVITRKDGGVVGS